MDPDLQHRAAAIRLFIMDVDGVLTEGLIVNITAPDGHIIETKAFNSQDGIALQWLKSSGVRTGVISGRVSRAVEVRASQLGMEYVYQGHTEKLPILEEIIVRSGLAPDEIAYAGDDLVDIPVMRRVGLAFAPANARAEVKRAAQYTTTASGGDGAVREMIELLLQAQGTWADILTKYEAK